MYGLRFVWDQAKNLANQRKHGVAFEEARTAAADLGAGAAYPAECLKKPPAWRC